MTDNAANLSKAITMQKNLTDSGKDNLLIDREITVATYTDLFLEQKKRTVSDTTYAGYMNRCKKIKEYFQTFKIKDLTQVQVERFLDYQLTSNHIQARMVKDIKVLLGSIIEQAVRDGLISRNPVKEATINKFLVLEHAKTTDTDEEFFSYEEALCFLSIVESHPLYELFFVTLFFGLRREEVLGMRWSCIDSERKEFTFG